MVACFEQMTLKPSPPSSPDSETTFGRMVAWLLGWRPRMDRGQRPREGQGEELCSLKDSIFLFSHMPKRGVVGPIALPCYPSISWALPAHSMAGPPIYITCPGLRQGVFLSLLLCSQKPRDRPQGPGCSENSRKLNKAGSGVVVPLGAHPSC